MGYTSAGLPAIHNVAELQELETFTGQRFELLDGQVLNMTGGTRAHNLIALGLFSEIEGQKPAGCRLYVADVKLRLQGNRRGETQDSVTYPDVMLACGPEVSAFYEENPVLLAEVLSDSTARLDKGVKRQRYLETESLQVYLLLSQTEMLMTVYQREGDDWQQRVYLRTEEDIALSLGAGRAPLVVNLERIYRSLAGQL